jgi:hypothetical protein
MTRSGWRAYQTVAYWMCMAGLAALLLYTVWRLV